MKVGDILCYACEYSARHPYFARVTRMTNKSVWVNTISSYIHSHDGYRQNGYMMPNVNDIGKPYGKPCRLHKSYYSNELTTRISGRYAYVWNGKPEEFYTD